MSDDRCWGVGEKESLIAKNVELVKMVFLVISNVEACPPWRKKSLLRN